jgi:hypothetical protein
LSRSGRLILELDRSRLFELVDLAHAISSLFLIILCVANIYGSIEISISGIISKIDRFQWPNLERARAIIAAFISSVLN